MRDLARRALVGAWVLAVVLGAGAVAVFVLSGRPPDEQDHRATVWATLLAALAFVPPAVVWGRARIRARPAAVSTREQVDAAADLLADRMLQDWSRQVARRGIQTPAPVRVRWEWADETVAADRQEVNYSPPLGTDPHPLPGTSPGEVLSSGLVTRLHDRVYTKLRHGRLVLVGGPGAGKTAAMILLLLEALRHRGQVPDGERARVPVPVWLTLGGWNPDTTGVREWVTATMARDHPYLRAVDFGPDAVAQLIGTGRVALFLDGLDEMPDRLRPKALQRLAAEAVGLRVVVTSRPDEYRASLQDGDGLPYAAVVDLRPVGPPAAAQYLLEGRTGSSRQLWQQVADRLQADSGGVLAQVLTTPLALSLARAAGPDPSWLLSPRITTREALHGRLWDQALVGAYPDLTERAHAVRWLAWIAHHMNTRPTGATRDLAWWHIPTWTPRWHLQLLAGLVVGLWVGLVVGLVDGLVYGLVVGFVFGLGVGFVSELVSGFVFGLVFGLVLSTPPEK